MPWYRPAVQCVAPPAQACGLYYMAELAEEYSRLTKKILTYCIQGVIAIHVLLLVSMSGSARHLSAADQGPASPVLPPHVAHSAGCRARCSSRTHIYTCPHVDTPTHTTAAGRISVLHHHFWHRSPRCLLSGANARGGPGWCTCGCDKVGGGLGDGGQSNQCSAVVGVFLYHDLIMPSLTPSLARAVRRSS